MGLKMQGLKNTLYETLQYRGNQPPMLMQQRETENKHVEFLNLIVNN